MALQDHPYSSAFPNYSEMIMEAIEELNEKEGSTKASITSHIESTHSDLPPTLSTHVTHTLEKLKQTGQLVMVKEDTYTINEKHSVMGLGLGQGPTNGTPIKRGRGRPPKPKTALPPGVGPSPAKPRGRPRKDPLAPVKPKSSGKPRGRPRKSPEERPVGGGGLVVVGGGVKRGRGRPKKNY